MEKIMLFLPSLVGIAVVALLAKIYFWYISKYHKDKIKSRKWFKQNKKKGLFLIHYPFIGVYAPTIEELIFRAPLVLLFDTVTTEAWYAVIFSSVIFGACHWGGKHVALSDVDSLKETDSIDDAEVLFETAEKLVDPKTIKTRKVYHVLTSTLVGLFIGYCGVKYQSIWLCVGLHSAFNVILPIVIVSLLISLIAIFEITTNFNIRKLKRSTNRLLKSFKRKARRSGYSPPTRVHINLLHNRGREYF